MGQHPSRGGDKSSPGRPGTLSRRRLAVAGFASVVSMRDARAQAWPTHPIRLIVAFSPGGFTDIAARLLAQGLSIELGQPVVVENRAGAGGIIGTEAAAQAVPDGYTLLLGTISTHAMNVGLYRQLPYDPMRSFTAVSRVASGPNILVAHPSLPATSVAELIALARARPGRITYGSGGIGTTTHLAGELFKSMAGVDLLHVPFRSPAPAATALLSGQVDIMFDTAPSALPPVRQGRLRALGITSPRRSPDLPDLPSLAETLPGFEMRTWVGVFAPAGTPAAIVNRLDAATRAALAGPDLPGRFAELGMRPFPAGPDEFATYVEAEIGKWVDVTRRGGITAE
ncbi:tripartite tricarboxylate transporter substrate binding protein [Roseomonas sp. NAR14]|uniref:Tripartite tricarboxylate transporter substrate binding protein n=1 Tax=Roseomonas acroporae TaxID=2937791 RepID=A0A9X2BWW9_9PROT|nr:tripartite tricarboxylate transporter substrate binding protein [Roseomonas acroporae]MCK8788097.1 tripartite tricarboxylate transporter substrate binding protein [Roseomonas acroporae]